MNRHERRKAARGRKPGFAFDRLLTPIAGTIYWQNGEAQGVWGKDIPLRYQMRKSDGGVRELTASERKTAHAVYGDPKEHFHG